MEYISSKEAAEKWDVHIRVVQELCKSGRIGGTKKYGNTWLIPADADKPLDPRKERKLGQTPLSLPRNCPELLFTTLYGIPGSGDAVAESLSNNPQAQSLFRAQLAYFRGDFHGAKKIAVELLESTGDPRVAVSCCFTLSLCAMYEGDAAAWLRYCSRIEKTDFHTKEERALRELYIGGVYSGISTCDYFPEWFCHGDFAFLPADSYPLARFLYLKYLMLSRGNPSDSSICRPFISQSRIEGALLSEIYCSIMIAIGYHDRGDYKTAAEILNIAIEAALPDRIFAPFAEYRSEFGILMDECFEEADKSALSEMRVLNKQLLSGWSVIYHEVRGGNYNTALTQRERHAAKLAAKGLKNAEIARRMCLSPNTVKRYISEAIGKLGAPNREALAAYIGIETETLP